MNCPFCNGGNPDDALFCKHCGKKLEQTIVCPVCKKECARDTRFCSACGAELLSAPKTSTVKRGMSEKTQKALRLSSGILMMSAVFFALIFAFFIGTTQRISESGNYYRETFTIWHFFGRAYSLLKSTSAGQNYSAYTVAAHYIPAVLSTVVAAATLICVVGFSLAAVVKFGLNFKRPNNYYRYAVAAVFSFLLGATLFDCIHSVSTESHFGALTGTTVTGMVFTCLLVAASLILKTVSVGNGFIKKQTAIDCFLTLVGILLLAFVSGFAKSEQADFTINGSYPKTRSISFIRISAQLSFLFDASTPVTADYLASFVLSVLAIATQIAAIVLTFVALIRRIGNYTEKRTDTLGIAIALVAVTAFNIIFSATAIEFTNRVISAQSSSTMELIFAAETALSFIFALFYLALSITHRTLSKKEAADDKEETDTRSI